MLELFSLEVMMVFGEKPKCSGYGKEIKGNDVVLVRMRYPMYKGMTEKKHFYGMKVVLSVQDCFYKKTG
ncbi:Fe3+ hydroxamate ABC transporter substrate-binding protein [Jeotgalibacillus proteolyticus]|uniref:Fe3+ hydroxamate ABC transporter substrate-binding protein n=1 Tax=Jeotgalibacillus proteolyticus TaxID=2082395 RepID=UPI001FD66A7D|nr:Fe3+ hydroxamate ABC transporter substrate-binding protein [Jeotgalibacillus proteolyticus]